MSRTIRDKADILSTFRYIQVSLMETLAQWVPTTPEMDVKLLFGQHIWDIAQHVDALGNRVHELRKPLHSSLPPVDQYRQVLAELADVHSTAGRLHGVYEVMLPGLATRYQRYIASTDDVLDAPTVRILERFLTDAVQMRHDCDALRTQLPQLRLPDVHWPQRLAHLEGVHQDITQYGTAIATAQDMQPRSPHLVETMVVRGVTLRRDPQREPCFTIVHSDAELHEYPGMSEMSRRERLHRHMNNEVGSLEIAAQTLADFPAAPWELRLHLARQCWDETRHVRLLHRRLLASGGQKGAFPIANFEWSVTCLLDSLPARLAVQNRTFEAGEVDLLAQLSDKWREAGDETTAEILEGILADEIQHVRFANQWLKRMAQDDPRILLQVVQGVRFLAHVSTTLASQAEAVNAVGTVLTETRTHIPAVNIADRRHAGFTDAEIHETLRHAGFRSLVPPATTQEVSA